MRKHGGTPSRRDKHVTLAAISPPGVARGRFVGGQQSGLAGSKPPPLFTREASSCSSQGRRRGEPWGASPRPSAPTYLPTYLPTLDRDLRELGMPLLTMQEEGLTKGTPCPSHTLTQVPLKLFLQVPGKARQRVVTYSLTRRSTGLSPTCGLVCMTELLLERSEPRVKVKVKCSGDLRTPAYP